MNGHGQQGLGVAAAALSSGLGGTAIVATRFLAGTLDPVTIGALRFAGGFIILAPLVLLEGRRLPPMRDWPAVIGLGVLFFGLFPVLFNIALIHTTAARGGLALATVPVLTMAAAAMLGIERPTWRKSAGVAVALAGVAAALGASLDHAPPGAWRGDLIMVAGALCMALYNVWSRPYIARSGPIAFAACGMAAGALVLGAISLARGGLSTLGSLETTQAGAVIYLAVIGGALIFYLWSYALGRTSPTLVAIGVSMNPVTAAVFGALLLGEPISLNLALGLVAVLAGITLAATAPAIPVSAR